MSERKQDLIGNRRKIYQELIWSTKCRGASPNIDLRTFPKVVEVTELHEVLHEVFQ